ncbi:MAG: ATP-binding protein [Firmicutes bacterium]|nr:ATP-binding protein [Bacillota bacterium]
MEDFDWTLQPSIDPGQIQALAPLTFVAEATNMLFLGPCGVGKSHLVIALGMKAVEAAPPIVYGRISSKRIMRIGWSGACGSTYRPMCSSSAHWATSLISRGRDVILSIGVRSL